MSQQRAQPVPAPPPATQATAPTPSTRGRNRMLVVLLTATFMVTFDFFVVNIATASLRRDFGAGPAALELIVGGYAFAYASGMVTGGRLGDLFGSRRLFVTGMASFAAASALCGVAGTPGQLVAARILQGLTGALMVPQVLGIITRTFPVEERGRALGWYGAAAGLGGVGGQVLGGLMLRADILGLGWRVIFLVNVPVGAVAAAFAVRLLPPAEHGGAGRNTRLDPIGAVGLAASIALLLIPLSLGREEGWPVWTWLCLAAVVPVGAATLRWQRTLARRGGEPVLDLSLFRVPSFSLGLCSGIVYMAYYAGLMFTLTLTLQDGMGLDPLEAGLAYLPACVTFTAAALMSRTLVGRYGLRAFVWSTLAMVGGLVMLWAGMQSRGIDVNVVWVMVALALTSTGNGVVLPSLIGAALTMVRPGQAGMASGALVTGQQFASAAGVAALGAVFFAAAGDLPAGAGIARGMKYSTLVEAVLTLAMLALTAALYHAVQAARTDADRRPAREGLAVGARGAWRRGGRQSG